MSSLRGEQALKDGLSFEFTWAARHLLEVMEVRAEAITLGGLPGEKGVDFRLHFSDHEEHHQVKRAFGTKGEWTFAALDSEKVLPDFRQRLADPKVHCFMVSSIPAVRLGYLADRARQSSDPAAFEEYYLTKEYEEWFVDLVARWGLSRDETWQRLQRVHACSFGEHYQISCCLTMLRSMVVGDAAHTWAHLRDFCFEHVHQRVTASGVWQWLAKRGVERQIINNDPRVLAKLHVQTKLYLEGVRNKLIKPPLPRQLATSIITALAESSEGKDIVVLGTPGGGKSAVMLQIAEACMEKGWPALAFRLDDLPATITARQLQEALDLPMSPAACMARASAGKPALVLIDQLDAVSQYSGRTGQLFDRVAAFVDELRAHRLRNPIHLVIACREVDWNHDGRFRPLHLSKSENKNEGIHKVESLTDEEIRTILLSSGFDVAMFSPRQREQLLRRPQYLALLIETKPDAESLKGIVTPKLLFDAYWAKKQRDLSIAMPLLGGNPWFEILKYITDKLAETALALTPPPSNGGDDDAPLAVKRSSLDQFPPLVINWMLTNGVLSEGNQRIRFGHESFFDYCFARFFEKRGQSLVSYLLQSEQTLIQRGQLRQVLAYQRDEDLATYLMSVRELLSCEQVRPHLKYLLITLLCEVPDPKDSEWHLISPMICEALEDMAGGINTSVPCLLFNAFSNSFPLFKIACEKGDFSKWLQTSGPLAIERLFRVILKHQDKAQQEVWALLEPLVGDDRYQIDLCWLSSFCHASNSRPTFDWLIKMMRNSFAADEKSSHRRGRFHSLAGDLAVKKPEWLAEWLAAIITVRSSLHDIHDYEILSDEHIESGKIRPAAERAPKEFIAHVLPAFEYAIKNGRPLFSSTWSDYCHESSGSGIHYVSPDEVVFECLVNSIFQMLKAEHEHGLRILDRLRDSGLTAMQRLHAAVLCRNDEICASLAATYLSQGKKAFVITFKGKLAACEMLKIHGDHISDGQLYAIESAILCFWPKHQNQRREDYSHVSSKMCCGNWRGYQQMTLLRAFPQPRLSHKGARRLAEWERKFPYGFARKEMPFNKKALFSWSPKRFLFAFIVHQKRIPQSRRTWDQHQWQMDSVMREVVANRPADFIHFLSQCDSTTPNEFIAEIDSGLMNLDLDSDIALEAAKHFNRLGQEWSRRSIRLLERVKPGMYFQEAFRLTYQFFKDGKGVTDRGAAEDGKRGEQLRGMATDSIRGQAIRAMCQMLWTDPELLDDLKPLLPEMMHDSCPAIRTELASLCYAVAFRKGNRPFATELFLRLVTDSLPDEHVLASHWPFMFLRARLVEEWIVFKPLLINMMSSSSSEVRSTAARLILIAVIRGVGDAFETAQLCVESSDPKVRVACADILSHNLEIEHCKPWTTEALLRLADDPDNEVCRATGFGFGRSKNLNFGMLTVLLARYVKTRAFVRGAGGLIEALVESRSILPATIFDIVETLVNRLDEPVESDAQRLVWHVGQISPILTRLYHENRDGILRKRALDLIDQLCVSGSVSHESLDQ